MGSGFGGIILAGGQSRRLGRDKATVLLAGATLLQHTATALTSVADRLLIVLRPGQEPPAVETALAVRYIVDDVPGTGPLGALLTGLRASGDARCFAVACDMPLVQPALLGVLWKAVEGFDAAVAVDAEGRLEPLCAVYSRTCIAAIERRVAEGSLRMSSFFDLRRIRLVTREEWAHADPEGLSFLNINVDADLARADSILRGKASRGE